MATTIPPEALAPVHRITVGDSPVHRFSVAEFHRMGEHGILGEDDRIELLDGVLFDVSPNSPPHASAVVRLTRRFAAAFGAGLEVRVQLPLTLSASQPEPDLAVVEPGSSDEHPATGLLVIEIAVTSQTVDRDVKTPLYAAAGVPEYWLLDVPAGTLEVRREPAGAVYRSTRILGPEDTVEPLQVPVGPVRVSELLGS